MGRFLPLILACVVLAACDQPKVNAQQVATAKLEAGTKVKAILLKELTSGGSREGSEVPLMVSEDVKDTAGHVLVLKGTPVTGSVTWSRSEGTLGSMLNQPARLKFKFVSAKAADGTPVKLSAQQGSDAEYELNRDNTGKTEPTQTLNTLAENKDNEKALEALRNLFENGQIGDLDDPATKAKVSSIADQLGLAATSRLAKKDEMSKVTDLVSQIRQGATLTNLATGGSATLVDAALELASVAGQVGSRLGRMIGGRNIHAYVGTPVEAYVLQTVEVKLPG